jgi:hypothetical protein
MKNGIIHTIRTQIKEFMPFFLESLYTHAEIKIEIR